MFNQAAICEATITVIRAAFLSLVAMAGIGCHAQQYGYLLDSPFSNAGSITEWTLRQTDDDRINDGVNALATISNSKTSCDRDQAVDGIGRIYQKLVDGWPGYTGINRYRNEDRHGPIPEARREENLEWEIRLAYDSLNSSLNPRAGDLFLRLKPDPRVKPRLAKIWNEVFTGHWELKPSLTQPSAGG